MKRNSYARNRWVRITALLLFCLCLFSLFTGCSSSPTVLKVGDEKVSYDMLRYFVMNYRTQSGHTAEEFANDETLQAELTEFVESRLLEIMTYAALADEYKIDLTDEEKDQLNESVKAMRAEYDSDEAYEQALKDAYLTEKVYKDLQRLQILAGDLYEYLTNQHGGEIPCDEALVRADVEAGNFFSVEYLYIYYSQTDKEEKVAFANDLHSRLLAGESMSALDREYSATYGLSMEYVVLPAFTYTQQHEDLENAILSVAIGGIADPVVRGDGVFIARRKAVDSTYVDENISEIIDSYKEREFARLIEKKSASMKITFQDAYQSLKYWEME